jgi:hypothetical protein
VPAAPRCARSRTLMFPRLPADRWGWRVVNGLQIWTVRRATDAVVQDNGTGLIGDCGIGRSPRQAVSAQRTPRVEGTCDLIGDSSRLLVAHDAGIDGELLVVAVGGIAFHAQAFE